MICIDTPKLQCEAFGTSGISAGGGERESVASCMDGERSVLSERGLGDRWRSGKRRRSGMASRLCPGVFSVLETKLSLELSSSTRKASCVSWVRGHP